MNSPERNLWNMVLTVALRDLCEPDNSLNRIDALGWLGKKRPTQDFIHVVTLLGLDSDATWDRLWSIAARPYADRRAVSYQTVENPIRTEPHRRAARRAQRKAA